MKKFNFVFTFILLVSGLSGCYGNVSQPEKDIETKYLAFQIFTLAPFLDSGNQPLPNYIDSLKSTVIDIKNRIGITGTADRHLAFFIGPIAFDQTDEQVSALITFAFDIALESDIAVGVHIDHGMFWGLRTDLNTADNIEWSDWEGTPNTGLRLDWSENPTKIMPQLCFNSPAVKSAVASRAMLIGTEVAKGLKKLHAAEKDDLFAGVIAGWETFIGCDFDSGKFLGYHALKNAGFSKDNPPADIGLELGKITTEFSDYWAKNLADSGVPSDKIYSHIAYMSEKAYEMNFSGKSGAPSYLEVTHWTPPEAAFGTGILPGFSTYPQAWSLEQLRGTLTDYGNPPWASCEGTAIDPAQAASGQTASGQTASGQTASGQTASGRGGMAMEGYLGNLFNYGAQVVNVYGWGVGDSNNPFRKVAESDESITAYRKFLRGDPLQEESIPEPSVSTAGLPGKIYQIQEKLPGYLSTYGAKIIEPMMNELNGYIENKQFADASKLADRILEILNAK